MTLPLRPRTPPAGSLHCPNCGAAADEQATQCPYCQARLATISCPTCFRRLFAGAAFCSHCGAQASRAAPDPTGDAARPGCPRCRKPMSSVQVGTQALLECAKCSGVWVAAEAFERLCADREAQAAVLHGEALRGQQGPQQGGGAPAAETRIRYRPCPTCKQMMNRINFATGSGVVLDVCRKHGTFFDRDELHRVVAFIQSGGLDRARKREREDIREEQRRLESMQTTSRGAMPLSAGGNTGSGMTLAGGMFDLFVSVLLDR